MVGTRLLQRAGGGAGIFFLVLFACVAARAATPTRADAQVLPTTCQSNIIFNIAGLEGLAGSTSSTNAGNLYSLNVNNSTNTMIGRFLASGAASANANRIALNGLAVRGTPQAGGSIVLNAWYAVAQATTGATAFPGNPGQGPGFTATLQPVFVLPQSGAPFSVDVPTTGRTLIMGGVNPANQIYYYAGYQGSTLQVFAFDTNTNTAINPGSPVLSVTFPGMNFTPTTGDLAFDGQGNMFIVAGTNVSSGTNMTQVRRVNAAQVLAGGTQTSTQVGTTTLTAPAGQGFYNGIAFGAGGTIYAQYASTSPAQATLVTIDPFSGAATPTPPGGVNNQSGVPGGGSILTDLAGCSITGTLTVQKNLPGGRVASTDQFTLSATFPEPGNPSTPVAPPVTTTGPATGNQVPTLGPVPAFPATTYTITEAAAGSTNFSNYNPPMFSCVDTSNGNAPVPTSPGANPRTFTLNFPALAAGAVRGAAVLCTFTNTFPTITTTPTPANAPIGTTLSDSATVTGVAPVSGTVTFTLFPPSDTTCTGTPFFTSAAVALSPGTGTTGTASSGSSPATNAVGTWRWVAVYSGNANNAGSSTPCNGTGSEPVTITQATSSIVTTPNPASAAVGSTLADSATVTGVAPVSGTVTFTLFSPSDTTCTGTPFFTSAAVALSPGTGTTGTASSGSSPATNAVGTWRWVAVYSGNANNAGSSTPCNGTGSEPVTITQATSSIVTTPNPASAVVGSTLADSATVTGVAPVSGTVTFTLFPPSDTTCTGTPFFTSAAVALSPGTGTTGTASSGSSPATNAVGTWRWVAVYSGNANNAGSSTPCNGTGSEPVTITQATSSIVTTPNPASAAVGSTLADSATVTGVAPVSGTVTFTLFSPSDTTCTGTPFFTSAAVALSPGTGTTGTASSGSSPATNAVGTWRWVAVYSGNANNAGSSTPCNGTGSEPVTITQATPTIVTTPTPTSGVVPASLADSATVTGVAPVTGTVTFRLYSPSDTTCTGTPAFTSADRAISPGTGTTGSASSESFTVTTAGTWRWVATFNGNTNNASVSTPCTGAGSEPVTITAATPTIVTTPTPTSGVVPASLSDSATVTGAAPVTGTVTFELFPPTDTTCTGTPAFTSATRPITPGTGTTGTASSESHTVTSAGTWHWVATFNSGNTAVNMNVSTPCTGAGSEPVTITAATPTIVTTPTPATARVGMSLSDSATVTGAAPVTGTATFELFAPTDTTCTGTPAFTSATRPITPGTGTTGTATSESFTANAAGTWRWVATFNSGDTAVNMNVSTPCTGTGSEPVTVTPMVISLSVTKSVSPMPYLVGQDLTYIITVHNGGPDIASPVTVNDPLPPQLANATFHWTCEPTGADTSCGSTTGTAPPLHDTPTIGVGGTVTYTLVGTVPEGTTGVLDNTVTVTPPPDVESPGCSPDCTAEASTPPTEISLSVTKSVSPDPYTPGGPLTYTITVRNGGPHTANPATVNDPLPPQLAGATFHWTCEAMGTGTSCGSTTGTAPPLHDTPIIGAGGSVTYTLTGTVPEGTTGVLDNTVTVTPPPGVVDTTCTPNCTASASTSPVPPTPPPAPTPGQPVPPVPGLPSTGAPPFTGSGPSGSGPLTLAMLLLGVLGVFGAVGVSILWPWSRRLRQRA